MRELKPDMMPYVPARASRAGETFWALHRRYQSMPMQPMLVRGILATPYVPPEPGGRVHLDGLLAWAVLQAFPYPARFDAGAAVVPVPLALLWVSGDHLPLWAVSDLLPQGDTIRDTHYWHKRYPVAEAEWSKKRSADMRTGRWKEYRVPLPALHVPEIRAIAIGAVDEVRRLLAHVTHVGKKPSQGFGRVVEWLVEPLEYDPAKVREAILLERSVPVAYWEERGGMPGGKLARGGWTPPYWYAPWHTSVRRPA